jgi:hypothetical protein
MRIPLPASTAKRIADRAVQNARQNVASRGWKSANGLSPLSSEGRVGIQTSVRYLMYQESGIKPFVMFWVAGKTVPLGCKQGDGPHIRKGVAPGTPGWVNIPHKGRVWRDQRWRHPGLQPKNFMHDAIKSAIADERSNIRADIMAALHGTYRG